MCEMLLVRSERPFQLREVFSTAEALERYGIAGFGWGVAWLENGIIRCFKSPGRLTYEPMLVWGLAEHETNACLFHLRRPSLLCTISEVNTQPYVDGDSIAFGHNGFFERHTEFRAKFQSEVFGESDSEIGFHMYCRQVHNGFDPCTAMQATINALIGEGDANVIALHSDGTVIASGRNRMNRLFWFRGERFEGLVTELHSKDNTIFERVLPWVHEVRQVTEAKSI